MDITSLCLHSLLEKPSIDQLLLCWHTHVCAGSQFVLRADPLCDVWISKLQTDLWRRNQSYSTKQWVSGVCAVTLCEIWDNNMLNELPVSLWYMQLFLTAAATQRCRFCFCLSSKCFYNKWQIIKVLVWIRAACAAWLLLTNLTTDVWEKHVYYLSIGYWCTYTGISCTGDVVRPCWGLYTSSSQIFSVHQCRSLICVRAATVWLLLERAGGCCLELVLN